MADFNYEESKKRLQEIVSKLESNDISLSNSLKLFEEASTISQQCQKYLDEAKVKIESITHVGKKDKEKK